MTTRIEKLYRKRLDDVERQRGCSREEAEFMVCRLYRDVWLEAESDRKLRERKLAEEAAKQINLENTPAL